MLIFYNLSIVTNVVLIFTLALCVSMLWKKGGNSTVPVPAENTNNNNNLAGSQQQQDYPFYYSPALEATKHGSRVERFSNTKYTPYNWGSMDSRNGNWSELLRGTFI